MHYLLNNLAHRRLELKENKPRQMHRDHTRYRPMCIFTDRLGRKFATEPSPSHLKVSIHCFVRYYFFCKLHRPMNGKVSS